MFLVLYSSVNITLITINMKFVCLFICLSVSLLLRAVTFGYLNSSVYKRKYLRF